MGEQLVRSVAGGACCVEDDDEDAQPERDGSWPRQRLDRLALVHEQHVAGDPKEPCPRGLRSRLVARHRGQRSREGLRRQIKRRLGVEHASAKVAVNRADVLQRLLGRTQVAERIHFRQRTSERTAGVPP